MSLNFVTGPGGVLGDALASDPRIAMISLTGSTEVGRRVAEICGRDLRRCSLELGGKNAVIVLDDANLDEAVKAVAWAGFGTTGQRCTATSRVIVHERLAKEFAERLVAEAEKLKIGDGLEPETGMGPLVNTGRVGAVHAYTEIGKEEGARLLTGGRTLDEGELAGGAYYAPTIFTDATRRDAHRAGGGLRSLRHDPAGEGLRRGDPRRQLDDLRPLLRYLHRERAHGLPRDARHQLRPGLYQCWDNRRRAASALRRDEAEW